MPAGGRRRRLSRVEDDNGDLLSSTSRREENPMATVMEPKRTTNSVAKVIEISAESSESFEDAIRHGIEKAAETVHDIRSAWVEGEQVKVEDGKAVAFRVDLKVTFVVS
jgi:flavin-binding protein dodecin